MRSSLPALLLIAACSSDAVTPEAGAAREASSPRLRVPDTHGEFPQGASLDAPAGMAHRSASCL